jgi:hypothetical protein
MTPRTRKPRATNIWRERYPLPPFSHVGHLGGVPLCNELLGNLDHDPQHLEARTRDDPEYLRVLC